MNIIARNSRGDQEPKRWTGHGSHTNASEERCPEDDWHFAIE